jgi:hypothetical protein
MKKYEIRDIEVDVRPLAGGSVTRSFLLMDNETLEQVIEKADDLSGLTAIVRVA